MKILSTGDWHFNAGFDEDVLSSVNQIIDWIKSNPVGLVAITGEISERSSEPGSRNLAAECIQRIADLAPVLIVRGNHDAPGDLLILSQLKAKFGVIVHEKPDGIIYPVLGEPIYIHTIPWITKARWQSLNLGASKEEGDQSVSQLSLELLKTNIALNQGYKHIVIGHVTIAGARAQNHQRMAADGVFWGLYDMKEAGVYAAMLGHIHLRQTLNSPREFYNGSVCALDYGESPDKFFSILDTDNGRVEWIKINTIHRQDVAAEWSPTGTVIEPVDESLIKGARVRVNLRVVGGDNVDFAKQEIIDWAARLGALECKVNPQVMTATRVRAAEMSKATSYADKLKQYWEATEFPDEATQKDMLIKLFQLEEELL